MLPHNLKDRKSKLFSNNPSSCSLFSYSAKVPESHRLVIILLSWSAAFSVLPRLREAFTHYHSPFSLVLLFCSFLLVIADIFKSVLIFVHNLSELWGQSCDFFQLDWTNYAMHDFCRCMVNTVTAKSLDAPLKIYIFECCFVLLTC